MGEERRPEQDRRQAPAAPKAKRRLSPEERRALKERQEALRRQAIREKSRQLYRIANAMALLSVLVTLLLFFMDFYPAPEETRSGFQLSRDVLLARQALVMTPNDPAEPFKPMTPTYPQLFLALIPWVLAAFLVLFLVDLLDPLGGVLQLAGMLGAVGLSAVIYWVALGGGWPGVQGKHLSLVLLGLFVFFVGCIGSAVGSMRRLQERETPPDENSSAAPRADTPAAAQGPG